jgi:uncharacterized protein YqeY
MTVPILDECQKATNNAPIIFSMTTSPDRKTTGGPQEHIEQELKTALKAGEKDRLRTLRMLLSEVKNERIRRGAPVDDATFAGLVRKAIKQRHEAAEQFRRGGREESARQEEREAAILTAYLPPAVDEEEIRSTAEELAGEQGLAGAGDLGKLMKPLLSRFGGRADGATLQRLAREVLAAREARG